MSGAASAGSAAIAGLVLAGGRSLRYGSEKAMVPLRGKTMLEHALDVLTPACRIAAVNANPGSGAAVLAAHLSLPCLPDPLSLPKGPLTGILAGLRWAKDQGIGWLATIPCDTPNLPPTLVATLKAAMEAGPTPTIKAVHAATTARDHYLCALWRVEAETPIQAALTGGTHPPVRQILAQLAAAKVFFDDDRAFANINRPEDAARLAVSSREGGG